jgi:hypothetical protein
MIEIAEIEAVEEEPVKITKRRRKLRYLWKRKALRAEIIRRSENTEIPYPWHIQERVRKIFPKNYFKHGITNDHDNRRGLGEIGHPFTLQSAERDLPIQSAAISNHIRRLRELDEFRARNENSSKDDSKERKITPCL